MKTRCFLSVLGATVALVAQAAPARAPLLDLDLTKGCPAGVSARASARFSDEGLYSTNANPSKAPSGVICQNPIVYPRAFTFEAEFVALKQRYSNPRVMYFWDESNALGGPKAPPYGVTVTFYRCNSCWRPELYLGSGTNAVKVVGPHSTKIGKGDRVKLKFTYDGFGNVIWSFAGLERVSKVKLESVASAKKKPCIGDKIGFAYMPFEGAISRVKITPEPLVPLSLKKVSPSAYIRGETDDTLSVELSALGGSMLEDVTVAMKQLTEDGFQACAQTKTVGRIASGKPVVVTLPVEARVKPGRQTFEFTVSYRGGRGLPAGSKTFTVTGLVGPRMRPHMPVVAWCGGGNLEARRLGFTHGTADGWISRTNDQPDTVWYDLDRAVAIGQRKYLNIGEVWVPGVDRTAQARWQKNGKPWRHALEVSNPVVLEHARRVAKVGAERIGLHPGLGAALFCSESRGGSNPSYNTEIPNYLKAGGVMPPKPKKHPLSDTLAKYKDGLLDKNDPTYRFWYWWRSKGDGWADYISAWADAYAKVHGKYEDGSAVQKKRPFFTFHDPVVRWASIWGVPGTADIASNWIYAAPDPMAVAGPTEQLFARAEANPGQQVMIMTQLICYRTLLAPWKVEVEKVPEWIKRLPNATYPAIPPDVLQEATWSMIAKPVRGIMYHGWGCIVNTGEKNGYCFTNPDTRVMISNLLNGVVAPLGTTLLSLGRRPPRVAIVESSSTSCLGQGYGNGWAAPHVTLLQRARLDPRVINEEGVLRDGLDGVEVVYLPQCQLVLPEFVERINAFQKRGGIVIGDTATAKVLKPDLLMPSIKFDPELAEDTAQAAEKVDRLLNPGNSPRHQKTIKDAAAVLMKAEKLRTLLAQKGYVSPVSSSSPDIITYSRQWKDVPYVFAISDKRTFGDYCGMYGVLMEKGVPNAGTVTLADPQRRTQAVYELSRGERVDFTFEKGRVVVPVKFTTNDGRLLAFLPEKIANLKVEVSGRFARGGVLAVRATVLGVSGRPIPAALPVEIVVTDAAGRVMDGSGWHSAEDGVAELKMPLNLDEPADAFTVRVRDRASGLVRVQNIR